MCQFVRGWPDLDEELIVSDGRTQQFKGLGNNISALSDVRKAEECG
jgi:hypothetical protein